MFFGISRFSFEKEESTPEDLKLLQQLVEKVRVRFRISCEGVKIEDDGDSLGIAVAVLAASEEKIMQLLDAIADFCEDSGFGRIASEDTLVDHLDTVGDEGLGVGEN